MQLPRSTSGRVAACLAIILFTLSASLTAEAQNNKTGVSIVPNEAERRVDVLVEGQPFTSYIWPDTLKKPGSSFAHRDGDARDARLPSGPAPRRAR